MKRNKAVKDAAGKARDTAQRAGITGKHAAERAGLVAQQAAERASLAAQHAGPMLEKARDNAGPVLVKAKDQAGVLLEKSRDNAGPLLGKAKDQAGTLVENAGPLLARARDEAVELYERAVDDLGPAVTEGRRRAKLAAKAARGEKPPRRWPWVAGAIAAGTVVGAAVTSFFRRRRLPTDELAPVEPTESATPATTGMVPDAKTDTLPDSGVRSANGAAHVRHEH